MCFEDVPLGRDVFVMDESWLSEYESAAVKMFEGGDYPNVGWVDYFAISKVDTNSLEAHFYPNIYDRFHRVPVRIPRSAFVACVHTPNWDDKPRLFVNGEWLRQLHLRPYSAFASVDAIGVKSALMDSRLAGASLVRLRDRIDELASEHSDVAFVSFADSLLLKANWWVGRFDTDTRYHYEPEVLIKLLSQIDQVFRQEIGLPTYAVITQGFNEYADRALIHTSKSGNHLSLNSLGLPFAQLVAIDTEVRTAIKRKSHPPADLYLDEDVFHSLRFAFGFDKSSVARGEYRAPMTSQPAEYYAIDRATLLASLEQ